MGKGSKSKEGRSSKSQKGIEKEALQESESSEKEGEETCQESQKAHRIHARVYQHSCRGRLLLCSCFCSAPISPWRRRPIQRNIVALIFYYVLSPELCCIAD